MSNWNVYQPLLDKSCLYFDGFSPLFSSLIEKRGRERNGGRDERQRKLCICVLHI